MGGKQLTVFYHPNSALSQCRSDRQKATQKNDHKSALKTNSKIELDFYLPFSGSSCEDLRVYRCFLSSGCGFWPFLEGFCTSIWVSFLVRFGVESHEARVESHEARVESHEEVLNHTRHRLNI